VTITLPRPALADRTWRHDSACARKDVPADLWTADGDRARAVALHVCQYHCPVMAECAAEADLYADTEARYFSTVVGGTVYDSRGHIGKLRSHAAICPLCPIKAEWPSIGVADPTPRRGRPRLMEPQQRFGPQCGTEAAYSRHRRRKEPIDEVCRDGRRARQRAQDLLCRYGICQHVQHRVVAW
jgi:hypothetical protein